MNPRTFNCNVGEFTFIIRYYPDHELHSFKDRSNSKNNWSEKVSVGTTLPGVCLGCGAMVTTMDNFGHCSKCNPGGQWHPSMMKGLDNEFR